MNESLSSTDIQYKQKAQLGFVNNPKNLIQLLIKNENKRIGQSTKLHGQFFLLFMLASK